MSAICGIFRRTGESAGRELVRSMLTSLRHRGPDGEDAWNEGNASLGHSALWVTPESLTEHLPYQGTNNHLVVTGDIRLDNRSELIAALELRGSPIEIGDGTIVLESYGKWGDRCVERLIGDFAFAIWDRRAQSMFCAVDPMNIRNIYYYLTPEAFVFASEAKALFALPEVPKELNEMRVAEYLIFLFEDAAATFYKRIYRLPAASTLTVTRHEHQVKCYWKLDASKEIRLASNDEYAEAFRELFVEAVRCRMRSAYPVGSALSGGLDSSSIACIAQGLQSKAAGPLHTYSLIFPGLPDSDRRVIDERPQIESVLSSGRYHPHFIEADRLSPMSDMERVHFHLDQANFAPNLYLHWAMYDSASRDGVRVFLDGFDGDSTVSHGFERLAELAQTFRWRRLWSEVESLSRNHLRGVRPRRIIREYCVKALAPRWIFLVWYLLNGRAREARAQNILVSKELRRRTDIKRRARKLFRAEYSWSLIRSSRETHRRGLTQALYGATLETAEKATGAFALEARYPFFDRRLMEFCLALPADQKLGAGWDRWVFRRAMGGILPRDIQWRANKGNLSPNFHRRLLDFERERLQNVSLRGMPSLEPFVDSEAIRAMYHEYERSHTGSQGESVQLFAAVNLAFWLQTSGLGSQEIAGFLTS